MKVLSVFQLTEPINLMIAYYAGPRDKHIQLNLLYKFIRLCAAILLSNPYYCCNER